MLTKEHAAQLVDALEIDLLLDNEEEVEFLEIQNPDLLAAYKALYDMVADDGGEIT